MLVEQDQSWADIRRAAREGRLLAHLTACVPRARWMDPDPWGLGLLHLACEADNTDAVVTLLASGHVDINARRGACPVHWAAWYGQPRVLQTLCAAGAALRPWSDARETPLDSALDHMSDLPATADCARVLLANGVRLTTVREDYRHLITPQLEAFERGVLRCRAAVVAMLRVKRASGQLVRWDKFLLAELALCIWSTRCAVEWQNCASQ